MNHPARRPFAPAAAVAVCVVLLGACGASHAFQPESPDGSRTPDVPQGLDLTVTTDRSVYQAGESVRGRITVVNRTEGAVRLRFTDSQRVDFLVRNAAGVAVWQWSVFRFFAQVLGEERLAAGDSLVYEEPLDGDFAPGSYTVVGSLASSDHPLQATTTFTVR